MVRPTLLLSSHATVAINRVEPIDFGIVEDSHLKRRADSAASEDRTNERST